ncbi:tetratricopeptide repeat protein [Sebaldella sp. S0638]|uniref:tetratricopeptide repeat protein n=1 Tax=Sebaldella sp. S0638 TaxID=2957809 RepID=UPI00209F232E|nr:tetratricopeptide repeat protein [Sebaldella sp. S0638]MCP1224045.1 sel1 repeat family protein [Sebaldella sp. S0638]
MKRIIILFSLLLVLSCGEKKNIDNTEEKKDTQTSENINNGNQDTSGITALGQSMIDDNKMNSDQNVDQAKIEQAKEAAKNGDVQAMLALSAFYYQSNEKEESKKWLEMAAEKGNNDAIRNLAIISKEMGNEKDYLKWSQKYALNTNDKNMLAAIGGTYMNEKNYSEAKKWFERAYNAGEKRVDINIAQINASQKNMSEALKWYKKVVARGETKANTYIGYIYLDQNKNTEARSYLIKGYNAGDKQAAMAIVETYRRQKDMEGMKKWYGIAAANGNKDAKKALASLNSSTTSKSNFDNTPLFQSQFDSSRPSLTGGTPEKSKTNTPETTVNIVKNGQNQTQTQNPSVKVDYNVPQEPKKGNSDPNEMFNVE